MQLPGVSVRLEGALSRNDRLRDLKPGETLYVRILQRIDGKNALLDVKGNVIHARFSEPVPDLPGLTLVLKSASAGNLFFEMKRVSPSPAENYFASFFGAALSREIEKNRIFQRTLKGGEKNLFSVLRLLAGSAPERSARFRAIADLLVRGRTPDLAGFSSLLSGIGEKDMRLAALLSGRGGLLKDERPEGSFDGASAAEALRIAAEAAHPSHCFVAFDGGEAPLFVDCVKGEGFFACEFSLPSLGMIEGFFRRGDDEGCSVLVSAEAEGYDALHNEASGLLEALNRHYSAASVEVVQRTLLSEKILALAARPADNSFDVTA